MNTKAMLNAYPDSLGGTLNQAAAVLEKPELRDAFRSFYIMPSVFHSDLDRGFSVISYELNRSLADEDSLERLKALGLDLKMDFVLNHVSVLSPQFQDLLKQGEQSPYRDFFIDWNRFWEGHGQMTAEGFIQPDQALIQSMFFRKPGLPILMVRLPDGRDVPYWNTFYQEVRYPALTAPMLMNRLGLQYQEAVKIAARFNAAVNSNTPFDEIGLDELEPYREQTTALLQEKREYLGQMDLNIRSPLVWEYYRDTLMKLAAYGAAIVRLDAFAYAPKAPGRHNFLNDPETWELLEEVKGLAQPLGLSLLPEIHSSYAEGIHRKLSHKGYLTYDFFLPGLLIDAIERADASYLVSWAREIRENKMDVVNMLGCHDGIPLLDLKGLLPDERIQELIDLVISRGGMVKNLHGQKNVYYQVNATYYSALGEDDRKMLLARMIQLFMPGTPQVWYLDLFAGRNDLEAVALSGSAGHKEINRTNLTMEQIDAALTTKIVQDQLSALKAYNQCIAFDPDAQMYIEMKQADQLAITWEKQQKTARLVANLSTLSFQASMDTSAGAFILQQG